MTLWTCFCPSLFSQLMYEKKAIVIQKGVKGWLARQHYKRILAAIILLQSCVRRMRAKRELKKLKVEARSVEHFKKLNIGMENKILQLQHKINEQVGIVWVWRSRFVRGTYLISSLGVVISHEQHVFVPPLPQQKENRELSEKLSVTEKAQTMEIERQSSEIENLRRSEQETRAKAERLPSLLEQLSFLQHELENTRREKEDLEEQTKVYKEQTEQVSRYSSLRDLPQTLTWLPFIPVNYKKRWHRRLMTQCHMQFR